MRRFWGGMVLSVVSALFAQRASAEIAITASSPLPGALVGDELGVSISVTSTYEVASARATVGTRSVDLSAQSGAAWATLSLAGEPSGSKVLNVTVMDAMGATASIEVPFRLDRAPQILLSAPSSDNQVVQSSVRVTATCIDDDPRGCMSLRVRSGSAIGTNSIDETVAVSGADGAEAFVAVDAVDSAGQMTSATRRVYVVLNPRLVPIVRSQHGSVVHTDGSRVLVLSDDKSRAYLETATTSVKIYDNAAEPLEQGTLVYDGAILATVAAERRRVYRWRAGLTLLSELAVRGSGASYRAAGKYLGVKKLLRTPDRPGRPGQTYNVFALELYDLENEQRVFTTDSFIPSDSGGEVDFENYLVHENGDLLWTNETGALLYRYRAGSVTEQGAEIRTRSALRTDGVNIGYYVQSSGYGHSVLITSAGSQQVCRGSDEAPRTCGSPALRGGWAAYHKLENDLMSVFRRSPEGVESKVELLAGHSYARAISDTGQVAFDTVAPGPSGRYLTGEGTEAVELGNAYGRIDWHGAWYVTHGNALFRVDPERTLPTGWDTSVPPASGADAGTPVSDGGVATDAGGQPIDSAVEPPADSAVGMHPSADAGVSNDAPDAGSGTSLDASAGGDAASSPMVADAARAVDGDVLLPPSDAGASSTNEDKDDDGCSLGGRDPSSGAMVMLAIAWLARRRRTRAA